MKNINVYSYCGAALVSVDTAKKISQDICTLLSSDDEVCIDFLGVIVLTTQCANAIFSAPFQLLGAEQFKRKISFDNTNDDLSFVLATAITDIASRS